jgi:glutamate synthase domain-containing protein 2
MQKYLVVRKICCIFVSTNRNNTMKRFFIEFKEISYGVVEVYAETEEEAREIADSDGTRHVHDSTLELGAISGQQDIE